MAAMTMSGPLLARLEHVLQAENEHWKAKNLPLTWKIFVNSASLHVRITIKPAKRNHVLLSETIHNDSELQSEVENFLREARTPST